MWYCSPMQMKYADFLKFINAGLAKWERIKKDFSSDKEMSAFLKKAYPIVMFDYHQLDISFARELYIKPKNIKTFEEIKKEEFRLKMVEYFEKELKEIYLDARVQSLNIEFIQMLKRHPEIKGLNSESPASIRIVIAHIVNQ